MGCCWRICTEKKKLCGGRWPVRLVHDGVCLLLEQVFEGVDKAEAAVPFEHSLGKVPGDLLGEV